MSNKEAGDVTDKTRDATVQARMEDIYLLYFEILRKTRNYNVRLSL